MKITLESTVKDEYGVKATIETPNDDLTLYQMIETLIMPMLIAYGYNAELVKESLGIE